MVILGITGNLAQIKLLPALYDLEKNNSLPDGTIITGIGRKKYTRAEFASYVSGVLHTENRHHTHDIDPIVEKRLIDRISYLIGNFSDPLLYQELITRLIGTNRVFYLATFPDLYENIFRNLSNSKLVIKNDPRHRLMIEKPIGHDAASSRLINNLLLEYFSENQLYRLDHYLGKETLQNIITFRFGNGIFEPIINRDYVDHIQITAAEDFGIGSRGAYYDSVGALRDVGQNHLLQMAALSLMKAPEEFTNRSITRERIRVLKTLRVVPESLVLGQYAGYHSEPFINPDSQADTYFAFKAFLDNSRFENVPIYFRGGKQLQQTVTEVSIVFKNHSLKMFNEIYNPALKKNILVYRVQPNEGIVLKILAKTPGEKLRVEESYMQFCYRDLSGSLPDPYESLIKDALLGDQTFFNDASEIEAEWEQVDKLLANRPIPETYDKGSWGPVGADAMIASDKRIWLAPSEMFCRI